MMVIYFLLLICFGRVESTDATSEHVYNTTERLHGPGFNSSSNVSTSVPFTESATRNTTKPDEISPTYITINEKGPGYVGCYPVGLYWQNVFGTDYCGTSVDECVSLCSNKNKSYAAISIRSCFCSNTLADVSNASDHYCNVQCSSNPHQICGSRRHYSVYSTAERLHGQDFNSSLNGSTYEMGSTTRPGQICPPCVNDSNADKDSVQEPVDNCCSCQDLWLRIVIDVAAILGFLFFIIQILLVVRFCRNRQRGMFDEWKRRSSGQARQVESGSSGFDEDLLHRNHSYRDLSGSSIPNRGLESVEQVSAVMKGVSARCPRAVQIDLKKLTTGTSLAEIPTKSTSSEGEYFEQDFLQSSNQPAPPDSKSKPKYNSKTCQKEPAEDTAEVEDTVQDKLKRGSLYNIMSKGSGMPSSLVPSKEEDNFPKDPERIINGLWGSQYGNRNINKSGSAVGQTNCSVSKDERIFEDPQSNTLPYDMYALPTKPSCRNEQPEKMPDTNKGSTPGDVELEEGYGRLIRLFKPLSIKKGKSKRGDDTSSTEEYSVLHLGSKDTDYDKLGRRGNTDGPVVVDKTEGAFKPKEGTYASLDDIGNAVIEEGTLAASQSGSKDTYNNELGCRGDTDGPVAVDKAESECEPDEGMYASVDDNGYAVVGEGTPTASLSGPDDTDDELGRRGDTDDPVAEDKAKSACKSDEGMYASVDDIGYAVVKDCTPAISKAGPKDTYNNELGRREDTDGLVAVLKAESACEPDEGMYASVDDNGYAVVGEGTPTASLSGPKEEDNNEMGRREDTDGLVAEDKAKSACKLDEDM